MLALLARRLPLLAAIMSAWVSGVLAEVAAAPGGQPAPRVADREGGVPMKWVAFPDDRFVVSGLPWFRATAPRLWRLPEAAAGRLPDAVQRLMRYPAGARIRFASDTSQLHLRVDAPNVRSMGNMSPLGCRGLDVYADGQYWSSAPVAETGSHVLTFFEGAERALRQITIYLPSFQEVRVEAVGLEADAQVKPPHAFVRPLPVVYYGSSIAQGGCACRPGMSYEAILGRRLDLDFANLGFSGAGKAEPAVVDLVAEIDACCYVFDLGKSFGRQPAEVYGAMLDAVRATHPAVPLVCITPIFSTRESYDAAYADLSEYVRDAVRQAVRRRMQAGDARLHLVEGTDLLGPDDADAFHEGVHPTDLGFDRIADRLEPVLREVLELEAGG
jgi:Arc/MetJ-type ribon-helix-helix transcriptional regulator